MDVIKAYRPSTKSLSSGQVLPEPYPYDKGRLIVQEMTELMALDLVRKKLVTKQMVLYIGYDKASLDGERGKEYTGPVSEDYYGRKVPKHANGTGNIDHYTSSGKLLTEAVLGIYDRVVDPNLLIRRVSIAAANLLPEDEASATEVEQLSIFTDYEAVDKQKEAEKAAEEKERRLQQAALRIQEKYGKNAMVKGMNFLDGARTIERNDTIGGHKAE